MASYEDIRNKSEAVRQLDFNFDQTKQGFPVSRMGMGAFSSPTRSKEARYETMLRQYEILENQYKSLAQRPETKAQAVALQPQILKLRSEIAKLSPDRNIGGYPQGKLNIAPVEAMETKKLGAQALDQSFDPNDGIEKTHDWDPERRMWIPKQETIQAELGEAVVSTEQDEAGFTGDMVSGLGLPADYVPKFSGQMISGLGFPQYSDGTLIEDLGPVRPRRVGSSAERIEIIPERNQEEANLLTSGKEVKADGREVAKRLGVSETDLSQIPEGVLAALGGAENLQGAFDLARVFMPQEKPIDPALIALQFFTNMAAEASKPGATALGAASTASRVPVEYLMDREKTRQAREAKIPELALQLAQLTAATGAEERKELGPVLDEKGNIKLNSDGMPLYKVQYIRNKKVIKTTEEPKYQAPSGDGANKQYVVTDPDGIIFNGEIIKQGEIIPLNAREAREIRFGIKEYEKTSDSSSTTKSFNILQDVDVGGKTLRVGSIVPLTAEEVASIPVELRGSIMEYKAPSSERSADERRQRRVIDVAELFANGKQVGQADFAEALADIKKLMEQKIERFNKDGVDYVVAYDGFDIIDKSILPIYGPEIANRFRNAIRVMESKPESVVDQQPVVSGGEEVVSGGEEEVSDDQFGDDYYDDRGIAKKFANKFVIGNREYNVISATPKEMSEGVSRALSDMQRGFKDVAEVYDILFKDGKLQRNLILTSAVFGELVPGFVSDLAGNKSFEQARMADNAARSAIELILRARSGAAVPETEVEKYMKLYYPSALDSEAGARKKLERLADFFYYGGELLSQGRYTQLLDNGMTEAQGRVADLLKLNIDPISRLDRTGEFGAVRSRGQDTEIKDVGSSKNKKFKRIRDENGKEILVFEEDEKE